MPSATEEKIVRYSPSKDAFYPENIAYPNLPTDLVTVTAADHQAVVQARSVGASYTIDQKTGKATIGQAPAVKAVSAVAAQALALMQKSDVTVLRCIEHGVAVPAEWIAFRASLRACVAGTLSVLPTAPAFPPGT